MGFDQKLKDLLRLQTTQPDAFTAELDEPWSGMQSDIELVLGILVEYQRRGKPLRLIEDFQINDSVLHGCTRLSQAEANQYNELVCK
jgi:hypothetical protein